MLREEFEKLTGIYPDADLYKAIEAAYYDFDGDKEAFCEAYRSNKDFLAQHIQTAANEIAYRERQTTIQNLKDQVIDLDARVNQLTELLDEEQEWRPVPEDRYNVKQADYEAGIKSEMCERLTDQQAAELLYDQFGFAKEKIKIHHSIPAYEVNRHGIHREAGTLDRLPWYCSSDWNYIRFDCGCMMYELFDGSLQPFQD